ncbi:MAG: hypothetical protein AAF485_14140 [Chloroflexota bacterium]
MDEIFKAIFQGMDAQSNQPQAPANAGNDMIVDLLGGVLGSVMGGGGAGAAMPQQPRPASTDDLIGDLVGSLVGSGGFESSGLITDLLGAVLGGQSGSAQAVNPLVRMLAEKIGISPALAQIIVSYFTMKMLSGKMPAGGALESAGSIFGTESPQSNGLDLDHLLDGVGDEEALNARLRASGMPRELAQQAGIDEATATRSLNELVNLVSGRASTPKPVTTQGRGLQGLLDTWEPQ